WSRGSLRSLSPLDLHALRLWVEPPPATGGARRLGHHFIELVGGILIRALAELSKLCHKADKGSATSAAIQNFLLDLLRELGQRFIDVDAALVSQFEQQALERPLKLRA